MDFDPLLIILLGRSFFVLSHNERRDKFINGKINTDYYETQIYIDFIFESIETVC